MSWRDDFFGDDRSRRARYGWYPRPPPKRPPPAHGIKMQETGATWWSARWIEALERLLPGDARLGRGRSYARGGRVHDLVVKGGVVTARVTGTRPRPYVVTLRVRELDERAWTKALAQMASEALFVAQLLSKQMPQEIDTAFKAARCSLFPERAADLETDCSCPDWSNPCKHVAAVHYVLGEAFDRDPFLLFELRGRSKDEVIATLDANARPVKRSRSKPAPRAPQPTVELDRACPYDRPADSAFLRSLAWRFATPHDPSALLRSLGDPAGWRPAIALGQELTEICARAAALARQLAGIEPAPPLAAVDAPPIVRGGSARTDR